MAKALTIDPAVIRRLRELPKTEKVECLLALRFIFQDRPTDLFVSFLGNHDEIKALLKSGKYR